MKNMETIEGNRIIAERMGLKEGEDGYRVPWLPKHHWSDSKYGDMYTNHYRHLQFHTSWDWLMPVWGKIKSDLSDNHDIYMSTLSAIADVNIEKAFWLLVEAVQWYNTNLTHPTHSGNGE